MHMRAAWTAAAVLLAALATSGCLGVDNMEQFKERLGFSPEPLEVAPPVARARASATLVDAGQPVVFSARGSADPQGFGLRYRWDFGDGSGAEGAEATHAYRHAGVFTATLTARSDAGLVDTDVVAVTVRSDLPPTAAMAVLHEGSPTDRSRVGEELTFTSGSRDPEGAALRHAWDLGDGTTASSATVGHAYAQGGRYTVSLRVEDPAGQAATALASIAVDETVGGRGTLALLGPGEATHALPVQPLAQQVALRLTFDPLLGLNALDVILLDAAGHEVMRVEAGAPPGTSEAVEVLLEVGAEALRSHAPGSWSLVVGRARGLDVDYAFSVGIRY